MIKFTDPFVDKKPYPSFDRLHVAGWLGEYVIHRRDAIENPILENIIHRIGKIIPDRSRDLGYNAEFERGRDWMRKKIIKEIEGDISWTEKE